MGAFAAVAENHIVMPRNIASDSHASCTFADTGLDSWTAARPASCAREAWLSLEIIVDR